MNNFGRAVSILLKNYEKEIAISEDMYAYGAPSECYGLLSKQTIKDRRRAERRACHAAHVKSMRVLRQKLRKRINHADAWFYRRYGFVPY